MNEYEYQLQQQPNDKSPSVKYVLTACSVYTNRNSAQCGLPPGICLRIGNQRVGTLTLRLSDENVNYQLQMQPTLNVWAVSSSGLFFVVPTEFFFFQVRFCPVKRGNLAGSTRNESDYSRRCTQIS